MLRQLKAIKRTKPPTWPCIPSRRWGLAPPQHIQTTRPSFNFDFKRLALFKITRMISSHSYNLNLLASIKWSPIFHVSLFEPPASNALVGQKQPTSPPILNLMWKKYWIPSLSARILNTLSAGLAMTNSPWNLWNSWKTPLNWSTTSTESIQLNRNSTICLNYDLIPNISIPNLQQSRYPL